MVYLKGKHDDMCDCSHVDNDDWYTVDTIDNGFSIGHDLLIVHRNGKSLAENEIPPCLLTQYKSRYPGRKIIKITKMIDRHGDMIRGVAHNESISDSDTEILRGDCDS